MNARTLNLAELAQFDNTPRPMTPEVEAIWRNRAGTKLRLTDADPVPLVDQSTNLQNIAAPKGGQPKTKSDIATRQDVFNPDDLAAANLLPPAAPLVPSGAIPIEHGVADNCFSCVMSNEAYHSTRDAISHSGMIELLRSPAHYEAYLNSQARNTKPNTYAAAHAAILEPARFSAEYITYPDRRTGRAWDRFKAANPGKIILTETEMEMVLGMRNAVQAYDEYPLWDAIRASQVEKSIFWVDEETGVKCRIRLDAYTPFVLFDVKGIDDARPAKALRQIVQMEYDLQAAMYVEGVRHFCGKTLPFNFIFAEDKKPHGICVHTAGQSIIDNGMRKFRRGLRAFKQLQETHNFHGYKNSMSVLEWPRYASCEPEVI